MKYNFWNKLNTDQKFISVIVLVYLFTRIYFYAFLNLSFHFTVSKYLVQYLDIKLLCENFWQSLFYLHSQPPLFNFLIGAVEIIFGPYSETFFFILFQLCGIVTVVLLYKLMIGLRIGKRLSLIITLLYALTPSTILYENLFFYTHLIVFFYTASAFCLFKFNADAKSVYLKLFFAFLLLISLTTSFFHLSWFILVLIALLFIKKDQKRKIIMAAIIPLSILLAVYFKNYFLFGEFNSSSWFGMNISRITVYQVPSKERGGMVKAGELSELAMLPPFPHFDILWKLKGYEYDSTGIAVLDEIQKSGGRTNFNNSIYIKISGTALNDSKDIIFNHTEYYLTGIGKAFKTYFKPPTQYKLLNKNLFQIKTYNKFFNAFLYGASPNTPIGYFTLVFTVLTVMFSIFYLIKKNNNREIKILLSFFLFSIVYVMIIGNFFEVGENNRFRFYTEIFSYIILGLAINNLLDLLAVKKSHKGLTSEQDNP